MIRLGIPDSDDPVEPPPSSANPPSETPTLKSSEVWIYLSCFYLYPFPLFSFFFYTIFYFSCFYPLPISLWSLNLFSLVSTSTYFPSFLLYSIIYCSCTLIILPRDINIIRYCVLCVVLIMVLHIVHCCTICHSLVIHTAMYLVTPALCTNCTTMLTVNDLQCLLYCVLFPRIPYTYLFYLYPYINWCILCPSICT